jgi:hypothetical protein
MRFLPAFGMHPMVLPLLGCQRLEQSEIGFADHAKLLDRCVGIALLIMHARHCGILIDRCNATPWRTQNQSQTKVDDDFRVSEMCEDLIDRPFVSSGTSQFVVATLLIKRSSFFAVAA